MPDINTLDCKIYVEANISRDELVGYVVNLLSGTASGTGFTKTVFTRYFEIDIMENNDFDENHRKDFPDGFLYFRYFMEFYALPGSASEARIALVTTVLQGLWSRGLPAVAACNYEDQLPYKGGYKSHSIPWIKP